MSTFDNEKFHSADLPDLSLTDPAASPADDEELNIPPPSEVATRINLLGKLIIPRSPH